jgi:hypothetical protein
MNRVYQDRYASFQVNVTEDMTLHVQGRVSNPSSFLRMELFAASPIDRMTSYAGSGLPFPCPGYAFDHTPNYVEIASEGAFHATFSYPNSYYTEDHLEKVKPSIFLKLTTRGNEAPITVRYELPEVSPLPLRSLTHRPGRAAGPAFYAAKEELMGIPPSAEATMRVFKRFKEEYDIA